MTVRLPDLTPSYCDRLCFCCYVEITPSVVRAISELSRTTSPKLTDYRFSRRYTRKKKQFDLFLSIEKRPRKRRSVFLFTTKIETSSGPKSDQVSSEVLKVIELLASNKGKSIEHQMCASFRYPEKEFESMPRLPVKMVALLGDQKSLSVELMGLRFAFPGGEFGIESVTVDQTKDSIRVFIMTTNVFEVSPELFPVGLKAMSRLSDIFIRRKE